MLCGRHLEEKSRLGSLRFLIFQHSDQCGSNLNQFAVRSRNCQYQSLGLEMGA